MDGIASRLPCLLRGRAVPACDLSFGLVTHQLLCKQRNFWLGIVRVGDGLITIMIIILFCFGKIFLLVVHSFI